MSAGMEPPTTTVRTVPVCPICGMFKKSGKISCCAPGGAWFENCRKTAGSNIDHTFSDGIQACEGKLTTYWLFYYHDCFCEFCFSAYVIYFYDYYPHVRRHGTANSTTCSRMHQLRYFKEIRQNQLLCSWRCLVRELWRSGRPKF